MSNRTNLTPQAEHGTVLLFIATIVLPFLFFLLSLTLDVGNYLREEREVQALLDKGGIHLQRFLPYESEAAAAFATYVAQNPLLQAGTTTYNYDPVTQVSDVITLEYRRAFQPFFARLVGSSVQFDIIVRSQVRSSPADVEILFDTSSYLAPSLTANAGWNPLTEQPAWVFQNGSISFTPDRGPGVPSLPIDPLVATQQCFSPPLLALKRGAVRTYQYLSSFRDNRVGLKVFPSGMGGFIDELRTLAPTLQPGQATTLTFQPKMPTPYMRNEYCAAAAEREPTIERYQVPLAPSSFTGLWRSSSTSGYLIDQLSGWQADPTFDLSGEQLIWSQAVRNAGIPHTPAIFDSIATGLLTAAPVDSRGGLRHASVKQAIIFAGDLPYSLGATFYDPSIGAPSAAVSASLETSLRTILDAVDGHTSMNFHLFYLVSHHQGLSLNLAQFQAGATALQNLFDSIVQSYPAELQERVTLRVLPGDNAQELSDEVISFLALNRRVGVISR